MNFTKTILNGLKFWTENNFVGVKEQDLSEKEKEQARENIGLVEETDNDALDLLSEMGVLEATVNEEGFILTDENNNILTV